MSLPVLLYGSENWIVKSKDKPRLTTAEIKFMQKTPKCTWRDNKTSEEVH
jgi:hypothetical protein